MPEAFQAHAKDIVAICLLVATANTMLAVRSISRAAALAFALGFLFTAVTWTLSLLIPREIANPGLRLLFLNACGAVGLIGLWCGFWLRARRAINWWFMSGLFAVWILPVAGVLIFDLFYGTYLPFAACSVTVGVISSIVCLYRKHGERNASDWAMIVWLLFVLLISLRAMLMSITATSSDPYSVWMFYLRFLPMLFTGIGLFSLLGFALDAIRDSAELARTDGLTGLLNRRAFDDELAIAVTRAERYQRDLSLIIVDIDNFKRINDTYGHPAGDEVIRAVSRVLLDTSRRVDRVARIGGEEFAMILADTSAAAALRLAERLRLAMSEDNNNSIACTASFGVACLQDMDKHPEKLLHAADRALYAAKAAGRNCVRYALEPNRDPAAVIGLVPALDGEGS